jgi:muramoyltetrapeptide carboxypeptidase
LANDTLISSPTLTSTAIRSKKWHALRKGDIVDVVAPARAAPKSEVERAAAYIKELGLMPRIPDNMIDPKAFPLCSNDDLYRFGHLKESLMCKDSKAIWCLRGGYGSARLIPMLEQMRAPTHTKLFIGFSDITVLHLFFYQHWNWSTVHGPMLSQIGNSMRQEETLAEMKSLIFGETDKLVYTDLEPMNEHAKKDSAIYGHIIGGNLAIVQTSIGTSWHAKTKGHILFLEDHDEAGYSIDRMLNHLSQAGLLSEVKAILFGDVIGGKEKDGISLVETALYHFAQAQDVPVIKIKDIGHGKINHPLPLGTEVVLKLGEHASLSCNTGVAR